MSYSQFYCTAKCTVADAFDLPGYIATLADFILDHINDETLEDSIVYEFEGSAHEQICSKLFEYFRVVGNRLIITVDSEENNTEVHDWLIEQISNYVMISNVMEINSATICSRTGVECGTCFMMKDGTFIGSDEIHAIVEKSFPQINS